MSGTNQERRIDFNDLSLGFGQEMLIYPDPADRARAYPCRLAGLLPGEAVLIAGYSAATMPELSEGQTIGIRVNLTDGIAMFKTRVMLRVAQPGPVVYLELPEVVKFRKVRDALRVKVTMPVLGANLDRPAIAGVAGKIKDISETGARLVMFQPLADIGEKIELKAKFQVGDVSQSLKVPAVVRSALQQKIDFSYGVRFLDGDQSERLILSSFVFHAIAFGEVQLIQ